MRMISHGKKGEKMAKRPAATEAEIREINVMAAIILRIINRLEFPRKTRISHPTHYPMNSVRLFVCR